ncbi:MAG TPA: hypothetical protein VH140_02405 [Candidatus Acidoferrum sp.]|nr:hypothetical protein [Candidatus Acidoferrum sp.]
MSWFPTRAQTSLSQRNEPATHTENKEANQNKPSLLTPLKPATEDATYLPITGRQRMRWFLTSTIGPPHLVGGLFTSAFGTAVNRPKEYGPGWAGFGDRYGMRLTGISTGNVIEASVGALWGEDPRYFRVPGESFKRRLSNTVQLTFVARRRDGHFAPAYARYMAISGNNFLSNTWRVDSEANTHDAVIRTADGFAGRFASNVFEEFWPDIKNLVFHRSH